MAACPAELAPPTMKTSSPRHAIASGGKILKKTGTLLELTAAVDNQLGCIMVPVFSEIHAAARRAKEQRLGEY